MIQRAIYPERLIKWKVLLWVIAILLPFVIPDQNIPTRHYTLRDGLPSVGIRCIFKDSRGLMWIGTDAGLCTFDGKSFRTFLPSEGMTANQIWSIAEDGEGNMWFGSYGDGLFKYDGFKFRRFSKKDGLADERIRVLIWSKKFHCLLAGSYGYIYTIRGDTITGYTKNKTDSDDFNVVTDMEETDHFIYVTTYGVGPWRFYPSQKKLISVHDDNVHYPEYSFAVFITSRGDTVFSYNKVGTWIKNSNGTQKNDTLGQIYGITEGSNRDLCLAAWSFSGMESKGGVFRFDGKNFRNYKRAFGITDKEIWTVYFDKELDILWIGTLNEGLVMVPFTGILEFPANYFSPTQRKIKSVYIDSKNRLWISGNQDLTQMMPDGRFSNIDKKAMVISFRQFYNNNKDKFFPIRDSLRKAFFKIKSDQLPEFLKRTEFNFDKVCEDTDKSFIFSSDYCTFKVDEKNCKIASIGDNRVDREVAIMGDTLIDSGWGYTSLHPAYKNGLSKIENAVHFTSPSFGQPKDVNRLVQLDNHYWYASGTTGLWMSKGMHLLNFNQRDSTISNGLNDICFDEYGHVIFGSNNGEICIATYHDDSLKIEYRITSRQGVQGNSISWLVADQKGKLWAGTNKGLNCIDLDSLYLKGKYMIRFMDEEEGYTGQTAKRAGIDSSRNLWIAAEDKLVRMDTKSLLSAQTFQGKIILKSLEVNNIPAEIILKGLSEPWTLLPAGKLILNHTENDLIFTYDILNYLNPGKDRFRYMLRGYDKTWNNWRAGRRAVFTNLSPGRYTLLVESYNLNTNDHAKPLEVEFIIRHPWWGLWYAQVLATLLMLVLTWYIIRRYFDSERKKQLIKSEIDRKIALLEMQALQAQMNPHFIFNCVNGIQYYVLANKMDEVLAYLSDFSKVVGESLANATLRMVHLEQEISFLHSYLRLELMRFPDKFEYEIRCGREGAGAIMVPPMLVQPFAENAIRHGFMSLQEKGLLSIVYEVTGKEVLKCTITDNGIGREKAKERERITQDNDRAHSAMITGRRIRLFNTPEAPEKYKIVYTDLTDHGKPVGLRVELFMPMEKGD